MYGSVFYFGKYGIAGTKESSEIFFFWLSSLQLYVVAA